MPPPGLCAALANAKLKKTRAPDSESTSSSSSGGSIGRGPGDRPPLPGMSMMDEMAATLARRKQKTGGSVGAQDRRHIFYFFFYLFFKKNV